MDLHELRIGNLLYIGGEMWQKEGQFEFRKITGQDLGNPFISEFIKPVTLTDKLILNLGFENWGLKKVNEYEQETTYALYNSIDGTSTFKVVLIDSWYCGDSNKEWVVRIDHDTVYFHRIEFVHDLQNAFYMLSGYDLTFQKCGGKSLS